MSIVINIARDYTKTPGGRYISEGAYSGEDFREKILKKKVIEALSKQVEVTVILDGGFGYAPSFLEESFGGLMRELQDRRLLSLIRIVSEEEPKLVDDVNKYMLEALEGNQ